MRVIGEASDGWVTCVRVVGSEERDQGVLPGSYLKEATVVDGGERYPAPSESAALSKEEPAEGKTAGRRASVTHDFVAEVEGELSVAAGETVRVIGEASDGWVTCVRVVGSEERDTGTLPKSYLQVQEEEGNEEEVIVSVSFPASAQELEAPIAKKSEWDAVVANDFVSEADGELTVAAGDKVVFASPPVNGWVTVRLVGSDESCKGDVPQSYLQTREVAEEAATAVGEPAMARAKDEEVVRVAAALKEAPVNVTAGAGSCQGGGKRRGALCCGGCGRGTREHGGAGS